MTPEEAMELYEKVLAVHGGQKMLTAAAGDLCRMAEALLNILAGSRDTQAMLERLVMAEFALQVVKTFAGYESCEAGYVQYLEYMQSNMADMAIPSEEPEQEEGGE